MDRIVLDQMLNWFQDWVDGLMIVSGEDKEPFFEAILEHTYRVRQHAVTIGKLEGLSNEELMLLELICLFHDLGRFRELYLTYLGEFPFSVDHGEAGVIVIEKHELLGLLSEWEKETLIECIRHHGAFRCPDISDSRKVQLLKLLRDSDKIDAFYREYHRDESFKHVMSTKTLEERNSYTLELVKQLMTGNQLHSDHIRYRCDRILLTIGYIYDFNFAHSFLLVEQNRYIDKLLDKLPQDEHIQELRRVLNKYIANQLIKE